VIGAGVAGLKAAADLAARGYSVTVLEARDRIGGRIYTVDGGAFGPIEFGAQWIHGSRNPIQKLSKKQKWTLLKTDYDSAQTFDATSATSATEVSDAEDTEWDKLFQKLERYIASQQWDAPDGDSLQDGITAWLRGQTLTARQLRGVDLKVDSAWVQEYAASTSKLSLNWFDNDKELPGGDSIIAQGYKSVPDYLYALLTAKGGKVLLSKQVTRVEYSGSSVTVKTADNSSYTGRFAIVTLPVGVLKAGTVTFSPSLPSEKAGAIARLGMGTLNKVILGFPDTASLPAVDWIERLPLPADNGRWREFYSLKRVAGKNMIVAFNAGDPALYPNSLLDATLVSQALQALRAMYGDAAYPNPTYTHVTRWQNDPYTYGSYSVMPPGTTGQERPTLAAPVGTLLYFAGEATSVPYPATVQGAWETGEAAAKRAYRDNK
jgi:monoamine oxidase